MTRGPLPQEEFDAIFSRVPRLTVELVLAFAERGGVLLQLRDTGPCKGLWSLPGGTVRFGEPVRDAVKRVARDELGVSIKVDEQQTFLSEHVARHTWEDPRVQPRGGDDAAH
jgi:ADP-ribose pyrophosphatase YjhB (NUDIX family)